jgi:hypothetical protein
VFNKQSVTVTVTVTKKTMDASGFKYMEQKDNLVDYTVRLRAIFDDLHNNTGQLCVVHKARNLFSSRCLTRMLCKEAHWNEANDTLCSKKIISLE